MSLKNQINNGESPILEFKETFRYDVKAEMKNNSLKNEASKAVCGMLNSKGGVVLIGVADDKIIKGIERDLNLYGKEGESNQLDNLLIDLNKHISDSLGITSKKLLNINVGEIEGKKIIMIDIKPSIEPVFHSEEMFYFRDGPRTIQLSGKKMYDYISDRKETLNARSLEEIFREKLEIIITEFQEWAQIKLEQNLSLEVNKNKTDGSIYDYIFGCIVPSTTSEDLLDFKSNLIKEYIDNYSIIQESQTYKTPDYARQYEDFLGEEILIYPDGKIYFCQLYNSFPKEHPEFSLGTLDYSSFPRLIVKKYEEKYSAPFSYIHWGSLSSLLEVICFLFNPKCKIQMVEIPTDLFHLEIILPNMIYEGKRRVLSRPFGEFPTYKSYLGTKKDISFHKLFRFNQIDEIIEDLKKFVMEYYQNPVSKGYSRF